MPNPTAPAAEPRPIPLIQVEHVHAIADVLYNLAPLALVLLTLREPGADWTDLHPDYVQEHLDRLAGGFAKWYGRLDDHNEARFVALVNQHARGEIRGYEVMRDYDQAWEGWRRVQQGAR